MPRARSPDESKAYNLYKKGYKLIEISKKLNIPSSTVRRWKKTYDWDSERSDKNNERSTNKNKSKSYKKKSLKNEVKELLENDELTDKQRLFCVYYIQCFNATKAYQKAYQCDYRVANSNAHKLLYNMVIKEEIKKIHKAISKEVFYSIFDLIRELIELNNVSVCDYINFKNVKENVGTKKNPIYMNVTYTELKEEFEADPKFIKEIYYTKRGPMVKLKEADKLLKDILLELENNKIKLKKVDAEIEYMNKRTEEIEGRLF